MLKWSQNNMITLIGKTIFQLICSLKATDRQYIKNIMESEQQVLLSNLFGFQFWESVFCVDRHDKLAKSDNRVELEDKQILLVGDALGGIDL